MHIACIYIQNFYFKSEMVRRPSLQNESVLIYQKDRGHRYVVDVSEGLSPAMIGASLDSAIEHYPYAILCNADFAYYQEESRKILARIHTKTDYFQQAKLGSIYVDLQDLNKTFQSEATLTTSLLNSIPDRMAPQIGISTGKFPAFLIAHIADPGHARVVLEDVEKAIAPFSITLLPVAENIKNQLRSFGLKTLGDIAAISEAGLQSQFGKIGTEIAHLSRGIDTSPVIPEKMPVPVDARLAFGIPVANIEVIAWAVNKLLSMILIRADVQGNNIKKMTLSGICLGGYQWHQKAVFKAPINRQQDFLGYLLVKFKMLKLPNAVEELSLNVDVMGADYAIQKTLFAVQNDSIANLHKSIRKIKITQGKNPIHLIKGVDLCSRIPERRWAMVTYDS